MKNKLAWRVVLSGVLCGASGAFGAPSLSDPSLGTLSLLAADDVALMNIDGLAFDGFGNLFGVLEVDGAGGGVVFIDKHSGAVTPLALGVPRADQIRLHPSGDFFVTAEKTPASATDRLFRVTVSYDVGHAPVGASAVSVTTGPDLLNNPEGLVVLGDGTGYGDGGDLLVAEDFTPGRVVRVTPGGATTVLVDTDAGLMRPEGLEFGDFNGQVSAALYVAQTDGPNVLRVDAGGGVSVFGDPAAVGLMMPDNLRFGPDGYLYVGEDLLFGDGRIIRVDSLGNHTVFATGFNSPQGMAFDPETGDMFISERVENRVWRVQFVPEPATGGVIAGALGMLALKRRRGKGAVDRT